MIDFLVFTICGKLQMQIKDDIQVIGQTISGARDFINNIRTIFYFFVKQNSVTILMFSAMNIL